MITSLPRNGLVIWMTGLSGAGKTTLARSVARELLSADLKVELLDGDDVRETLSRGLGFSREDRETNVRRIGFVARLLARNGVAVLASAISPYRQSRDDVRCAVESDGVHFVEVYVRCPLGVLVERDVKGLYKKALAGEIPNFTGISDPYEEPLRPDCTVDSSTQTVDQSAGHVISTLLDRGILLTPASVVQPAARSVWSPEFGHSAQPTPSGVECL